MYIGDWGTKMKGRIFHVASSLACKRLWLKVHVVLEILEKLSFKETFLEIMFSWH